ncbi:uncharacterized protein PHALS_12718 [Plasmopara halstedii]|uniref:Uncharacterized protein n=1 Tax=Plasmopara halstedii TaxID=4781 RepID=A0A0P1ANN4_PLAHL|nr:uncharacterized protein PHALS_12718 [Plasmopara halstedii]CEG42442.1 hypothetical protein PHALS_12718 [Plasmopara halstedii]|eukprot:XP_024578811.1 hypothetical protein PHALS_12718 [Plasmopara halstedii]
MAGLNEVYSVKPVQQGQNWDDIKELSALNAAELRLKRWCIIKVTLFPRLICANFWCIGSCCVSMANQLKAKSGSNKSISSVHQSGGATAETRKPSGLYLKSGVSGG